MRGATRLCWHCDEPIKSGQPETTYVKLSGSADGSRVTLHERGGHQPWRQGTGVEEW